MKAKAVVLAAVSACGGGNGGTKPVCDFATQTGCPAGQACEQTMDGPVGCFTPLLVRGQVVDLATGAPVAGATVVAQGVTGGAASALATTDASGGYELQVASTRDAGGAPVG